MALKFDLTGFHKRAPDLGPTREAERVPPVSRLLIEANHVALGYQEPPEGRYNTLSRLTYGRQHAGASDERALVESAAQLRRDAKERSLANNTRNFSLPLDIKKAAPSPAGAATAAVAAKSAVAATVDDTTTRPQLIMSELHQAQQTSRDILTAFNRRAVARGELGVFGDNEEERRRLQRSPPRLQAMLRQHELSAGNIQQASDMKEHMRRMNSTSIVEGASTAGAFGITAAQFDHSVASSSFSSTARILGGTTTHSNTIGSDGCGDGGENSEARRERREALQSTHKSSFEQRDSADQVVLRKQAALELRRVHHTSSATPIEDQKTQWASEARSKYANKVTPAPVPLCTTAQKQHLKLDDAEGRELLKSGDALRSLYQADLKKPGPDAHAAVPIISWHKHQISLGSDSRKTVPSLYRASFTPTVFVPPGRSNSPPAAGKKH